MNKESEVIRFYNKYPYPSYHINTQRQLYSLPFQKLLLSIIRKYLPSGKILEVGCGTGELVLLLSLKGYDTLGIDVADTPLKVARKNSKKLKIISEFKKADILNLKLLPGSFDAVIANGVLHHTNNPLLGFKNMVRMTKKGGLIIVAVYNKLGSAPRRFYGQIANLFGGKSLQSKITFIKRLLPPKYKKMPDAVIADAFFHPQEASFSISDITSWFNKNKIVNLETHPSSDLAKFIPNFILEIIWMVTLKANVFIMVGKKI